MVSLTGKSFLLIKWPQFRINEHTCQLLVGHNAAALLPHDAGCSSRCLTNRCLLNGCSTLLPVSSVTHRSLTVVCPHFSTTSCIGWTCQKGLCTSWPSWCIVVCTVKLLGTLPTISLQPLTSLPGSISIARTDNNFSYLAVDSTRMAVGLSRSLVRPSGTHYLKNLKIRHVVLTVLISSLRQSCSVSANVTSALEVFLKRYALYKFTFYLLNYSCYQC